MIEFAVAMPVLIILIMYIHDLALMKRWYDQTEFVALQMVNMIQNVSQKRANKAITLTDLKYITAAAYLTIYPETTMYWQNNRVFTHFPIRFINYVKGNSDSTASCIWRNSCHSASSWVTQASAMDCATWNIDHNSSTTLFKKNTAPSNIYPTLKISPGEVKIIVESAIYWTRGKKDSTGKTINSAREAFGFFLLSPKSVRNKGEGFFNSVVIFSPKPGLFSETPPQ